MIDEYTPPNCIHAVAQYYITGLRTFVSNREEDGVLVIGQAELSNFYIVQIEMVCLRCGDRHTLEDDEWEVA